MADVAVQRRYMNIPQAAEYTTFSKEYLYLLVKAKTIPYSRIGKRIVFDAVKLDAWIAKHSRPVAGKSA